MSIFLGLPVFLFDNLTSHLFSPLKLYLLQQLLKWTVSSMTTTVHPVNFCKCFFSKNEHCLITNLMFSYDHYTIDITFISKSSHFWSFHPFITRHISYQEIFHSSPCIYLVHLACNMINFQGVCMYNITTNFNKISRRANIP